MKNWSDDKRLSYATKKAFNNHNPYRAKVWVVESTGLTISNLHANVEPNKLLKWIWEGSDKPKIPPQTIARPVRTLVIIHFLFIYYIRFQNYFFPLLKTFFSFKKTFHLIITRKQFSLIWSLSLRLRIMAFLCGWMYSKIRCL